MFRKLVNWYFRKQTKNLTNIPLIVLSLDYKKYKKHGAEGSCTLSLHPAIEDAVVAQKMSECVEHIRKHYDMDEFTRVL